MIYAQKLMTKCIHPFRTFHVHFSFYHLPELNQTVINLSAECPNNDKHDINKKSEINLKLN